MFRLQSIFLVVDVNQRSVRRKPNLRDDNPLNKLPLFYRNTVATALHNHSIRDSFIPATLIRPLPTK